MLQSHERGGPHGAAPDWLEIDSKIIPYNPRLCHYKKGLRSLNASMRNLSTEGFKSAFLLNGAFGK